MKKIFCDENETRFRGVPCIILVFYCFFRLISNVSGPTYGSRAHPHNFEGNLQHFQASLHIQAHRQHSQARRQHFQAQFPHFQAHRHHFKIVGRNMSLSRLMFEFPAQFWYIHIEIRNSHWKCLFCSFTSSFVFESGKESTSAHTKSLRKKELSTSNVTEQIVIRTVIVIQWTSPTLANSSCTSSINNFVSDCK